jgi:glyoxylase-like metal-dependent hydrolase (beta-lactamase superfamily II)
MTDVTRRTALAGAATIPALVLAGSPASGQSGATAAPAARQAPGFYRQKIGALEVVTLHDGFVNRPLDANFVRNAPFEAVQKALTDAFLPSPTLPIPFTQTLVVAGDRVTLIDTGTGGAFGPTAGFTPGHMSAAGYPPERVNTIVISHFHADHINGIRTREGALAFANAEILVPEAEWAFWMSDDNMNRMEGLRQAFQNIRRVFNGLGDRVKPYRWNSEVVTGVTALDGSGHTPGHTVYAVASENRSMLLLSDTTNHPALFVRNPDWSPVFDMDADKARASRRALLDRAAADRMQVVGYHFPFPATGFIARDGQGYQFVPQQWSPLG